jgi:hypothetical protein
LNKKTLIFQVKQFVSLFLSSFSAYLSKYVFYLVSFKFVKLLFQSHPMMKQISIELMDSMLSAVLECVSTTSNNPMKREDHEELGKTKWYADWRTHCGELVDPACPAIMGECWAMGVLTCRKECDAKFLLRGNFTNNALSSIAPSQNV